MDPIRKVRLTANFRRTLEGLEAFLSETGAARAFDELLDDLAGTIIPNLERFPDMGRDFRARVAGSVEAARGMEELRALGASLCVREYIFPPFLLLYATDDRVVHLLAIRHHRQLSFDFTGLWDV